MKKGTLVKKVFTREVITAVFGSLLTMLFVYTAVSKLFDPRDFQIAMDKQPLPLWLKPLLLKFLPATELGVVLLLLFTKTRLWGFIAATGMMLAFTIYVGLGLGQMLQYVPCSCGGVFRNMSWPNHFILNLVFLAIAAGGWYMTGKRSRNGEPTRTPSQVRYT